MKRFCVVACGIALTTSSMAAFAATDKAKLVDRMQDAQAVITQIMSAPDKGIPSSILAGATCLAVIPSFKKAAFVVGAQYGQGVATCRTPMGWSAPVFVQLAGGSFGFQIGVEATDLVLLFMTSDGMNSLLRNKLELGADASVAAGPVGRQAGATTDLKLNAQILSYSRSKGAFAGVALTGAVIQPGNDDMRDVYGAGVTAKEVLQESKVKAPAAVQAFPNTLARFSTRKTPR